LLKRCIQVLAKGYLFSSVHIYTSFIEEENSRKCPLSWLGFSKKIRALDQNGLSQR
jgi:hypothetical protein